MGPWRHALHLHIWLVVDILSHWVSVGHASHLVHIYLVHVASVPTGHVAWYITHGIELALLRQLALLQLSQVRFYAILLLLLLLLLLSLGSLELEKPYHLQQLVVLWDILNLVPVLLLELMPALDIALDLFPCGLSVHGQQVFGPR